MKKCLLPCLILFFLWSSCEDWNYVAAPLIESIEVSVDLLANKRDARLIGTIQLNEGLSFSEYGYIYSTSDNPRSDPSKEIVAFPNNVSDNTLLTLTDTIKRLPINKVLYFQLYILIDGSSVYSDIYPLATNTISLTTDEIQIVDAEKVLVSGTILGLESGAFSIVSHGHCWSSINIDPRINDGQSDAIDLGRRSSNGIFQSLITSFAEDQVYYIRSYAIYEDSPLDTIYSSEIRQFQLGDVWVEKTEIDPSGRYGSFGFLLNEKIYVGGGFQRVVNNNIIAALAPRNDFFEYDPSNNDPWLNLGILDWANRTDAVQFVVGNKAYVGWGYNPLTSDYFDDFRVFDGNSWSLLPDNYSGPLRRGAVSFAFQGKGYMGFGMDETGRVLSDLWAFDPDTKTWNEIVLNSNIPLFEANTFILKGKVYIGFGENASGQKEKRLWTLEPKEGLLTEVVQVFPGEARSSAIAFAVGSKAYVGTGITESETALADFWEFNVENNNSWKQLPDLPGQIRFNGVGIAFNGDAYVGLGLAKLGGIGYEFTLNDWIKLIIAE